MNHAYHGLPLEFVLQAIGKLTVDDFMKLPAAIQERYPGYEAWKSTQVIHNPSSATKSVSSPKYTVILQSAGINKIHTIKVVRVYTNLGLKETKGLVEAAPCVILIGAEEHTAVSLISELAAIGAVASKFSYNV